MTDPVTETVSFDEWWEKNYANLPPTGYADYTFGEEAWNAAQRESWQQVFQIVSDRPDWFTHNAIKALEGACGSMVAELNDLVLESHKLPHEDRTRRD